MGNKLVSAILGVLFLISAPLGLLSGCTVPTGEASVGSGEVIDLMSGIRPSNVSVAQGSLDSSAVIDFAVRLFQQSTPSDKNSLISPLSVLCALAMTANGADGNTLAQMEEVFGISISDLNAYLYWYLQSLSSDSEASFHAANSIWFKDTATLTVENDFLQLNADYYGADIYRASFDDNTLKAVNDWVNDHTDGMIEELLTEISPNDVMYLINALAFDAKWQDVYQDNEVRPGTFTSLLGEERVIDMMYSDESLYLDDGKATGFIKYYAGGRYAFAALLPNEGLAIDAYIATLTGQGLADTLGNAQHIAVSAAIPKFESEYSLTMNGILRGMGMSDAFDGRLANLTKLGRSTGGNLYISTVIHKTFISVDPKGTRAAAVVGVGVTAVSARRYVYLDRPFVYMLIDCETNLPFFIGAMMDVG